MKHPFYSVLVGIICFVAAPASSSASAPPTHVAASCSHALNDVQPSSLCPGQLGATSGQKMATGVAAEPLYYDGIPGYGKAPSGHSLVKPRAVAIRVKTSTCANCSKGLALTHPRLASFPTKRAPRTLKARHANNDAPRVVKISASSSTPQAVATDLLSKPMSAPVLKTAAVFAKKVVADAVGMSFGQGRTTLAPAQVQVKQAQAQAQVPVKSLAVASPSASSTKVSTKNDCAGADQCLALGQAYSAGRGVVRNDAFARSYYGRACELGNGSACYALGAIYEMGNGTSADLPTAITYYKRSCQNGNTVGCDTIKRMPPVPVTIKHEVHKTLLFGFWRL